MKRIISLVLSFCLLLSCLPMPGFADDIPVEDDVPVEDEISVGEIPAETPVLDLAAAAIENLLAGAPSFDDILLALAHEEEWPAESKDAIDDSIRSFLLEACGANAPKDALTQINSVLAAADRFRTEELTAAMTALEAEIRLRDAQALAASLPSALDLLRMDEAAYADYLAKLADLQQCRDALTAEQQAQVEIPMPDYSDYQYRFSRTENGWLIHTSADEANIYLAPGTQPNHTDAIPVQLTEDLMLSSEEGYLTFGPAPAEFGVSQNEDEAVRLWLFKQGQTNGWLNGFSIVSTADEIASGEAYLVCAVRFDAEGTPWLNLVLPGAPEAGSPYTVLKTVPLQAAPLPENAPTPADEPGIQHISITVNWDQTAEYVDSSTGYFYAPDSSQYNTSSYLTTANIPNSGDTIATLSYSVPQAGGWGNGKYMTPFPLEDCLFTISSVSSEGTYTVKSKTYNSLYLDIEGNNSGRHAHPCSTANTPIYILMQSDGTYWLSSNADGTARLGYIGAWNVFTNDAFTTTAVKGFNFHLFRRDGDIYHEVKGDTIADGDYLIAAKTGGTANWLIVRPSYPNDGNNASAAGFLIAGSRDANQNVTSWNYGSMDKCYTTLYFKGVLPGEAEIEFNDAGRHFQVHVVNDLDPATLPSLAPDKIDETKTMYTIVGGEVRARIGGIYTQGDISFAETDRHVSAQVISTTGSQQTASALLWNNAAQAYTGAQIDLTDCLFTFTGSENAWTISAKAQNDQDVNLCTEHGLITSADALASVFEAKSQNVDSLTYFTLKSNSRTLFYWGWKMFTYKESNEVAASSKKNYGTDRFLLYAPVGSEGNSSSELPGFRRVDFIENNGQYLIAAVHENAMFFIRPYSGGKNNDYAAQRNDTVEVASTVVAFQGLSEGSNHVQFQNQSSLKTSITVQVLGDTSNVCEGHFSSDTGAARGGRVEKMSISSGMTYDLGLRDESGKQLSNDKVTWFCSNREYASIDQNGTITFTEPVYVMNQEPRIVTIYAYHTLDKNGCLHKLDVQVLKNDYGSTAEEINLLDYYIAQKDNSTVYLGIPMQGSDAFDETNFREVELYEVIYLRRSNAKPWALNFFVRPDDGYALTYLHANNSQGSYYKLDSADPQATEYYTASNSPIKTQMSMYGKEDDAQLGNRTVTNMIQRALDLGCVAAFGFTRQDNATGDKPKCALYFHSDPLPTVTKTVAYTIPHTNNGPNNGALDAFKEKVRNNEPVTSRDNYGWKDYVIGEGCTINDIVIFKISVALPDSQSNFGIVYSEMMLTEMAGFPLVALSPNASGIYDDSTQMSILGQMASSNGRYDFYAYHTMNETDADNYANKKEEVYNQVTLTSKFTTAFQGSKVIDSSSKARVALQFRIDGTISHVNLSLDDGVAANVYFDLNNPLPDYWAKSSTPYFVAVTSAEKKMLYRFTGSNAENLWIFDNNANTHYCRYSIPIGIQDLFDEFTVHIEDQYGTAVTDDFHFSVEKYVTQTCAELQPYLDINHSSNAVLSNSKLVQSWEAQSGSKTYAIKNAVNLNDLLKKLLNFGYYTQVWLQDSTRPDSEKYQPTAVSLPNFSEEQYKKQFTAQNGNGITFTGIALEFSNTKLGMRVYFTSERALQMAKIQGVEKHLAKDNNQYYELTNAAVVVNSAPNTYFIRIADIAPKLLGSKYQLQILQFDDSNNTYHEAASIQIAPLAYVYLMANQSELQSGQTNLVNMLAAMYHYHDAAKTNFGFTDYTV